MSLIFASADQARLEPASGKIDPTTINSDALTIVACFKFNSLLDCRIINRSKTTATGDQDWMLGISTPGGGQVRGLCSGVEASALPGLSVGVVYQLAMVYDKVNVEIFLDGVSQATAANTIPVGATADHDTKIASSGHDGTVRNFDGEIDYIAIWARALPAGELDALGTGPDGFMGRVNRDRLYCVYGMRGQEFVTVGNSDVVPDLIGNGPDMNGFKTSGAFPTYSPSRIFREGYRNV